MQKFVFGVLVIAAASACGDQGSSGSGDDVLSEFGETAESAAARQGLRAGPTFNNGDNDNDNNDEGDGNGSSGPATSFSYWQLYATADGQTHWRKVTEVLTATVTAPPAMPVGVSATRAATGGRWASFQSNWGLYDHQHNVFHTASSNRWMNMIRGTMHVQASDGQVHTFRRGDMFDFNDGPGCNCAGHIAWAEDDGAMGFWTIHALTPVTP